MTGPRGGVIGVKRELALERFLTMTAVRFETSDEDPWLNAVLVEAGEDGRATSIEQILRPPRLSSAQHADRPRRRAQRSKAHHPRGRVLVALEVVVERRELHQRQHLGRGERRGERVHAPGEGAAR